MMPSTKNSPQPKGATSLLGRKPLKVMNSFSIEIRDQENNKLPWFSTGKDSYSLPNSGKNFILHLKGEKRERKMEIPGIFYISMNHKKPFYTNEEKRKTLKESSYFLNSDWQEILKRTFKTKENEDFPWEEKAFFDFPKEIEINSLSLGLWPEPLSKADFFFDHRSRSQISALWGSLRNELKNHLEALSEDKSLEISLAGIGYRAEKTNFQGKEVLSLYLGYSHPINFFIPENFKLNISREPNPQGGTGENQRISLQGESMEDLMAYAQGLRKYRKPDDYKGKGVLIHSPKNWRALKNFRKEGKKKKS